ncbi:hypothetical protein EPUS_09190 [Endocarpon pusillum Z07020]|uniref:Cyanovirin-N domain-containing protein n=1 Tax=Endocarpon pusillum (strain Z07020 / HMAS-L-300199) TaxID=1263415 RepID=U1GMK2_ENDPU|nr:uncharacterized protein EPUS_09190 [Endocarpon pusillum Z07020]ERF73116.1 hypothetical protein EPUS_09190 [Endocarpon pusillum Z07020]
MSFFTHSQNTRIDKRDNKQYLVAELATGSAASGDKAGWYVDTICLDDYIRNDHARGPGGDTGGGGWRDATIDLGERLANDHGRFKYNE